LHPHPPHRQAKSLHLQPRNPHFLSTVLDTPNYPGVYPVYTRCIPGINGGEFHCPVLRQNHPPRFQCQAVITTIKSHVAYSPISNYGKVSVIVSVRDSISFS
jgi:hypothetical protein